MLTKEKLFSSLENLPDKFSAEEVIDRIILLQKIENGYVQSETGKGIPTKMLKRNVKKWSK